MLTIIGAAFSALFASIGVFIPLMGFGEIILDCIHSSKNPR